MAQGQDGYRAHSTLAGQISRRRFLAAAAAAAAWPALGGCGGGEIDTDTDSSSSGASGGGKVSITIFALLGNQLADMPKAFADDYMSRHKNVEIKLYENSNAVGYPKMLAAKRADPDRPMVNMGFFNAALSAQGDLDDMWNALDYGALSNAADVGEEFHRPDSNGIGIGADQLGIVYNTKSLTTPPAGWTDLWADSHRGKLTLFDYWWYAVFMAAKIEGGSLEDMERGWELWKSKAGNIRSLVTSNPEWQQVLSNGTAEITSCFQGTGVQFKGDGAPVDYAYPSEGAIAIPVYLQTVKGNTDAQQEVCVHIVNEMLSPRWSQMWSETALQSPANSAVTLPDSVAGLSGFRPENLEKLIQLDWAVVAKNSEEWRKRWDADVKANI